jgi:hypothetical protein
MKKLHFSIVFGLLAAALTLFFVLSVRLGLEVRAIHYMHYLNYLGMKFGFDIMDMIYGPREFGIPASEAILFDVFLVLTSGIQWFLVGWAIDLFARPRNSKPST